MLHTCHKYVFYYVRLFAIQNICSPSHTDSCIRPYSAESLDGVVKLQMDWYPFLADRNSFAFKSIAHTIENAVSCAEILIGISFKLKGLVR